MYHEEDEHEWGETLEISGQRLVTLLNKKR